MISFTLSIDIIEVESEVKDNSRLLHNQNSSAKIIADKTRKISAINDIVASLYSIDYLIPNYTFRVTR